MRFTDFGSRTVFAAFDGGEITSDAGVLLLRERAEQISLFDRMAACFTDHRDPLRIKHQLPTLLAQRVCGIAMGYEDINDHDTIRNDPAVKLLASSPLASRGKMPAPLAGKSTLNRLEQSREAGNPRYHQMVPNLKKLSNLFTDIFLNSYDTPPKEITLDIDATDIKAPLKFLGAIRRTASFMVIMKRGAFYRFISSVAITCCWPSFAPVILMVHAGPVMSSGVSSK